VSNKVQRKKIYKNPRVYLQKIGFLLVYGLCLVLTFWYCICIFSAFRHRVYCFGSGN